MLAEHVGGDLRLPETVQGLIAARIDALTADEKALLQNAAVLGKVFWPGAVGGADDRLLHALERKEFVRRDRRSSVAGETQYAFHHLLVRDVAYSQIPRGQRLAKHRAAAEWIASLSRDRSEDRAEMLAHHYSEALALADVAGIDASTLHEPARKAFADAAARALALNAWPAAFELGRKALALTDDDAPERPRTQMTVAYATWYVRRDDPALIASARDGFLAQGDIAGAAEASGLLSRVLFHQGDGAAARAAGERAVELARQVPPCEATGRAIAQYARLAELSAGESETALALAREALALAGEIGSDALASHALNTIGVTRVHLGDAGGIADLERSLDLAHRAGAVGEVTAAMNNLGASLSVVGRLAEAVALDSEVRALHERHGSAQSLIWNNGNKVAFCAMSGDLDGVITWTARYFAHAGADQSYGARGVWSERARALLARGQTQEALADAERALARLRETGHDAQSSGSVLVVASRCLLASGRSDEADRLLIEALEWSQRCSDDVTRDLALHLAELGRGGEYLELIGDQPGYLWRTAASAAASGTSRRRPTRTAGSAPRSSRHGQGCSPPRRATPLASTQQQRTSSGCRRRRTSPAAACSSPPRRRIEAWPLPIASTSPTMTPRTHCSHTIRSRSSSASRSTSRFPSRPRSPGR
jgi:tetratricopeptide (TPR) repeat protein